MICFITLVLILQGCGSGHEAEQVVDTILLILRNAVQCWRLYTMIKKQVLYRDKNDVLDVLRSNTHLNLAGTRRAYPADQQGIFFLTSFSRNSLIANSRVGAIDFSNVRQESLDIESFGVESYADDDMYVGEESDDGL
jgi:hypothetical protein